MAGTIWLDKMQLTRKVWLLTDGSQVTEPDLEETSTGRKVRLKGTEQDAYSKNTEDLIFTGVEQIAATRKARPWMRIDPAARDGWESDTLGKEMPTGAAQVHIIRAGYDGAASQHSSMWWRFRHNTMPIEATLEIRVTTPYQSTQGVKRQTITVHLALPVTDPSFASNWMGGEMVLETDARFSRTETQLPHPEPKQRLREFVMKNPWAAGLRLGDQGAPNERAAVALLLDLVRQADELDQIQIPDLRDNSRPAWLDLDLTDTNVNDAFIQTLAEYLDGAPNIAQAMVHYQEMLACFRSVGVVLENKTENDFLSALSAGDQESLRVKVQAVAGPNNTTDNAHTVSIHLPTGTFVVECLHKASDKDEIAHAWEEAVTMASLTGKKDALLRYAEGYRSRQNDERTRNIMRERKKTT